VTLSYWDDRELAQASATDEHLLQAIGRISTYSKEGRYVWRGQSKLEWGLNPGLVRRLRQHGRANGPVAEPLLYGHERQLLESARAAGYGRSDGRRIPDIELLAVLQHHGAATRLLDVSSDPMVALWFAVEDQGFSGEDGALFAINVSRARIISGTAEGAWEEILDSIGSGEIGFYEPPGADERIKVQRGRFIFSKLIGDEHPDLSLPITIRDDWSRDSRKKFYNDPRGPGRPETPSILVLKIPKRIKQRLLRLLENSYGYTSETMYPDLSGFASANGWLRPLRPDRRPSFELTSMYLPVAIDLGETVTSVKDWDNSELLTAANRELSISAVRIDYWMQHLGAAPQYWTVYHADEVIGVFKIDKRSWQKSNPNRYICDLSPTNDADAVAALGYSFTYNGEPLRLRGRGFFVDHTEPQV
jgi:FRG domain